MKPNTIQAAASVPSHPSEMIKLEEKSFILLVMCVLAVQSPAEAWYKQAPGPNYYFVGRASGLLAGIRRSAVRRTEPEDSGQVNNAIQQNGFRPNPAFKNMVSIFLNEFIPEELFLFLI